MSANEIYGGQIWWRGNSNFDYLVQPSVFRPKEKDGGYKVELNINARFRPKAVALRDNLPDKDAWFEWLFLMQHYRHPTRLLDWTESPLIAWYFAINPENEIDNCSDGALFALSPCRLNKVQTGDDSLITPLNNNRSAIAQRAFDDSVTCNDDVPAVLPTLIDQRMIAQLSVFTIHNNNQPLEKNKKSSEFLIKYKIPCCSKRLLRDQLKQAGIRPSKKLKNNWQGEATKKCPSSANWS
jgi:hypothetical protein